ncbi:MAG TPA: DUF4390 domain-containing protein [Burkholderiales bacterium]|nr:DUF4390 domain-containing protein [Burkholderiales bacterium]
MTVSSTRWCRRTSGLAALVALCVALVFASSAAADIEVKRASLAVAEDGYVLEADFSIQLTPPLEDVLSKGVSLYFLLEFELIRPRWYWFNDKIAETQHQYRLSYNALTRQYRVGTGSLYQNFATLADALEVLSRVRRHNEIEPGLLKKDTSYVAAVRLRLDTSQLPKPFHLSALGSRDWNIASEWYRWTVTP